MSAQVDLVVNTWERSYREVLAPGFFRAISEGCQFGFARRVALINNVDDAASARARAQELMAAGELTSFHFVADSVAAAYEATGLEPAEIGAARPFTEFLLVAVALPGSDWLLHWDAGIAMIRAVDWITPSIELMERDRRILCANPDQANHPIARTRAGEHAGRFRLAPGFSDQLFLARRSDLAQPIYDDRCLASLRYPLSEMARTYEMRIDSYMRHNGRLRAYHLDSAYAHPPAEAGFFYPQAGVAQRLRRRRNMAALAYLRHAPGALRPRCTRDLGGGI